MGPDRRDDSQDFGLWPAIAGYIFAGLIIYGMFSLATGFL